MQPICTLLQRENHTITSSVNFLQARYSSWRMLFLTLLMQPILIYTGWSDVTKYVVTIRSPFCGYNTTQCIELNGEDLSCCWNKIESVSLRKCVHGHWLTNKAYLSAIAVTNITQSFTHKMAAKINWQQNYVIVTLCINIYTTNIISTFRKTNHVSSASDSFSQFLALYKFVCIKKSCLQCVDAVGWAAGRASGL